MIRNIWLVLMVVITCSMPTNLSALGIQNVIEAHTELPNAFAGYTIPTREELFAHAPFRRRRLLQREVDGPSRHDCNGDLDDLEMGFEALYPDAPDIFENQSLWKVHVTMVRFPDLELCNLHQSLLDTLTEVDEYGLQPDPVRNRTEAWEFDINTFRRTPLTIRLLRGRIADLFWLSYKGYAPAMLKLAKLGARDDIVRLRPRFAYYLLRVSENAGLHDSAIVRLRGIVHHHLSHDDRAEINERIDQGRWPLSERMVID